MYKQVIVVVKDLDMSTGKTAAQVAHASYSSAKKSTKSNLANWEKQGQKKIVVKASEKDMFKIMEKCKKMRVKHAIISDAGLTELKPGTVTALGIGPDRGGKIDKITGSLPLLD